jgi:hypothetical protein
MPTKRGRRRSASKPAPKSWIDHLVERHQARAKRGLLRARTQFEKFRERGLERVIKNLQRALNDLQRRTARLVKMRPRFRCSRGRRQRRRS